MAAAMASMALQTRLAAAPGGRPAANSHVLRGCSPPLSRPSSSSWTCRALAKDEKAPDMASAAPASDVVTAVQQATTSVTELAAAGAKQVTSPAEKPHLAPASTMTTAPPQQPQQTLTAAAEWYKLYGRSVTPGESVRDVYYGPNRPLWKGAFTAPKDVPDYLTGEFPGDYGCDIFKLARLPANYARLRSQELMNGRWAMLGITGCLAPELIISNSIPGYEPVWFNTGAQIFSDAGIDYLGMPGFINAHSLFAVVVVQALLMGLSEYARIRFVPEGVDRFYPGGKTFDPLGFASDPELLDELKVKEIKNGRLAMMAMAGLFAQGAVTGLSPLQNFHDFFHL